MAKKKKKKKTQYNSHFQIEKYIASAAKKLPIHKVYLDPDTISDKLGGIVVSRKRPNGEILFCSYIVDLGCLGVKDIYYEILDEEDFDDFIIELGEDVESIYEEIDINYAANIIYAAVEYADKYTIAPVEKFDSVGIHMLPDVDDVEYMDIECGVDGRPFLRHENNAKAYTYIAKLDAIEGVGNYGLEFFEDHGLGKIGSFDFDEDFEEWEEDEDDEWEEDNEEDDDEDYTEFEEVKKDD